MAKHKPKKAHIVVEGHCPGVYKTYDEVLQQIKGYVGKVNFGYDSMEEAERAYKAVCDWRALSPENAVEKLTISKAKYVIRQILQNSSEFNIDELQTLEKLRIEHEVVLTCFTGIKGAESTITSSNGVVKTVAITSGTSSLSKSLEIGYVALQWANELVLNDINVVNIWGLDSTVIGHLTNFAPKSRDRGWLNASGKPMGNREILEPILTLYEGMKDKVTLHASKQPVDDDAPF